MDVEQTSRIHAQGLVLEYLLSIDADDAANKFIENITHKEPFSMKDYSSWVQARFLFNWMRGVINSTEQQSQERIPLILEHLKQIKPTVSEISEGHLQTLEDLIQKVQWCCSLRHEIRELKESNSEKTKLLGVESKIVFQQILLFIQEIAPLLPPPKILDINKNAPAQAEIVEQPLDKHIPSTPSDKKPTDAGIQPSSSIKKAASPVQHDDNDPREDDDNVDLNEAGGFMDLDSDPVGPDIIDEQLLGAKSTSNQEQKVTLGELAQASLEFGMDNDTWLNILDQTNEEVQEFKKKRRADSAVKKRRLNDHHPSAKKLDFDDIEEEPLDEIELFSSDSDNDKPQPAVAVRTQKRTPPPRKKSGGTKKRLWSEQEVKNLVRGLDRYGLGNWSHILRKYEFDPCRDGVSLRDKYRNMVKAGLLS
ncbi:hypothetical protein AKO1_007488 [Acrasis kona]|uniref:Uncharacterized protein n=1 Tax=Acrasis kona TaxID=1008807 RepID=A0AAW2YSX1_9EUKA